jgi:uncharacterized membrane protein YqhA
MFWTGAAELAAAVQTFWRGSEEANAVVALVMGATDAFLFGVVLLIFAGAITFGFVLNIAPQRRETLPSWMQIEDVHVLKRIMIEVVIVFLVVDFATDISWAENLTWVLLVKPIAVVLIAAALRLISVLTSKTLT